MFIQQRDMVEKCLYTLFKTTGGEICWLSLDFSMTIANNPGTEPVSDSFAIFNTVLQHSLAAKTLIIMYLLHFLDCYLPL